MSDEQADESVNLLLPPGHEADFYHKLCEKLVGEFGVLSGFESALPDNTPILNDYTWILSVPATTMRVQELEKRLETIPEARDVEIERAARFGISDTTER